MFTREDRSGDKVLTPLGWLIFWIIAICFLGVLIGIVMWGVPKYSVWRLDLKGQAQLREQEWAKKIVVEEAKAKEESAGHLASAEIIRAKGVADAIEILGESLKGQDEYLRWKWIEGLHDSNTETIYIPTEANLPIIEAGRKIKTGTVE